MRDHNKPRIIKGGWGEISVREEEPPVPDPEAKVVVHAGRGNISVRSAAEWQREQEAEEEKAREILDQAIGREALKQTEA